MERIYLFTIERLVAPPSRNFKSKIIFEIEKIKTQKPESKTDPKITTGETKKDGSK